MQVDGKVVADNTNPAEAFGYEAPKEEKQTTAQESTTDKATPQDAVNSFLKTAEYDDKGKIIYPEDIDPMLKVAVSATKSFRDTQSSFTKGQQELKGTQAELDAVRAQLIQNENPMDGLSPEEQNALNELKYTNPDEWFKKMKVLESGASKRVEEKFAEVKKEVVTKTAEQQRADALVEYNETAENKLTQEQLLNEVPPGWHKQIAEGKLSFEDFLVRADKLIYGGKTVETPNVDPSTNLSKVTGGVKDPQVKETMDYSQVTF